MWKCKPRGWLWGLPLLALVGLLVVFGERRNVEADLSERATAALGEAGLGWARVRLAGRDAVLTGTAPNVQEREDAIALAEKTWGVRIVDVRTEYVERISPYVWSADFNAGALRLGGYIPEEADRRGVMAMARSQFPEIRIFDEMKVASGAPDHRVFMDGVGFSLKQLAGFEYGSASLSDRDVSFDGRARSKATFDAVKKALDAELPKSLSVAFRNISAPPVVKEPEPVPVAKAPEPVAIKPYVWRADFHSNRVTLSGNVPDESARTAIRKQAERIFIGSEILDEMEVGYGAPADWAGAATASLAELARLQTGSATLWDTDFTLRGRASSEARRDEVLRQIDSRLPGNYHGVEHDLTVPLPEPTPIDERYVEAPVVTEVREEELRAKTRLKPDQCQTYLNSILATNVIHFKVASAEIEADSIQTLAGLSHVANRCKDSRIEIAGHTDADGNARFNQTLSLNRARAVVTYLTNEGVAVDRLSAVGYGKTRPIVPNSSPENKARNRRIEFSVKEF